MAIICVLASADVATAAVGVGSSGIEDNAARELRIYKDTLLHGVSEQIQTETAIALLVRGDRQSKVILMEALVSTDNTGARQAVCRGLIQSVSLGDTIGDRKEFMEPLIGLLVDTDGQDAKLAAEALLVFKYKDIRGKLTRYVTSDDLDRRIRLNVVYALQLRSDPDAISDIINLIDDADGEISQAAEKALQEAFGIPVGSDKQVWRQILKDLQRKSPNEIRRDRSLQQARKVRRLQSERDMWQGLYLSSVDNEYESADENVKGKFLTEKLSSSYAEVKLWALDKVSRRPGGIVFPDDFGTKLLELISDEDRSVRLETVRVLSTMSELNPAEKLLSQFRVEGPGPVRLEMLDALGEACYYAFSPGSNITLSVEVKDETLDLAKFYMARDDPQEARIGAEVIRKLLELNGLEKVRVENYLKLILKRYEKAKLAKSDLRYDLLGVMARLCSQAGSFKERAEIIFKRSFIEGLDDADSAQVREVSAIGLSNINKAEAFRMLKEKGLIGDASETVRMYVIELAAQTGKAEDVEWLSEKLGFNGEGDAAYKSIVEILRRQNAGVVEEWARKFVQNGRNTEQIIELYEISLKKAKGPKDTTIRSNARRYLLDVYLKENPEKSVQIVAEVLKEGDAAASDPLFVSLKAYLDSKNVEQVTKLALLESLSQIEAAGRAGWLAMLDGWKKQYAPKPEPVAEPKSEATPEPVK
jgi:HEAT repeat protein